MATNLLIGYSDIPFAATSITVSGATEDSAQPAINVIMGGRGQAFQTSAVAGVTDLIFDLGASVTKATNFLYVARGKILKQQGSAQALLSSSPDNVTYTSRIGSTANLSTRTFTGPAADDLFYASGFNDEVAGGLPTSAFRYWRFRFGIASPTKKWMVAKLYCGSLFDFGKDPERSEYERSRMAPSTASREPGVRFSLNWKGISTTLRNSFISSIGRYSDVMPVVLYDINDKVFDGWRTLHCTIQSWNWKSRSVFTGDLSVNFEEQI
jgi:hypothetical protein